MVAVSSPIYTCCLLLSDSSHLHLNLRNGLSAEWKMSEYLLCEQRITYGDGYISVITMLISFLNRCTASPKQKKSL